MIEDEYERTFLAKFLPDLENSECVELEDCYIPKDSVHPVIRLRRKGDKKVITKKYPKDNNTSEMVEETIVLNDDEYSVLSSLEGKSFLKKRYKYEYENGKFCEVDVYQEKLKGLVVVDFEFKTKEEKENFRMPSFCLKEITNEEFLAGGMLCGKSYGDLIEKLNELSYNKIISEKK